MMRYEPSASGLRNSSRPPATVGGPALAVVVVPIDVAATAHTVTSAVSAGQIVTVAASIPTSVSFSRTVNVRARDTSVTGTEKSLRFGNSMIVPFFVTWSVADTDHARFVEFSGTLTDTVPPVTVGTAGSEPTVTMAPTMAGVPLTSDLTVNVTFTVLGVTLIDGPVI